MDVTVRRRLRNYIDERLRLAGDGGAFKDSDSLFASGRLDSMTAVQTVVFLENEFGVDFASLGFDVSKVDSIDAMSTLIAEQGIPLSL